VDPPETRRAPDLRSRSCRFGGVGEQGASGDFAGELKDTTSGRRGDFMQKLSDERVEYQTKFKKMK
jgi:hypothetical protein